MPSQSKLATSRRRIRNISGDDLYLDEPFLKRRNTTEDTSLTTLSENSQSKSTKREYFTQPIVSF